MFLKPFYDTEGPFGLPMKDKQALALDARLKSLPKDEAFAFRRRSLGRGLSELQPGERADVSWITEETPDRLGDIVLAAGMDDGHFQLNPIVTLNHAYDQPPVGKSLWRRKVREGSLRGVKAKTHYPARPENWSTPEWLPDFAYEMVKADLLRGKSIGFFPLKVRTPTAEEIAKDAQLTNVRFIIEEWLLAEYACCYLPMQPNAVVEQVSKSVPEHVWKILGVSPPIPEARRVASGLELRAQQLPREPRLTTVAELRGALRRALRSGEFAKILRESLQRAYQFARGMV